VPQHYCYDSYEHIPEQCIHSFYFFSSITLPTRCYTNVITVTVIPVILGNIITASNSSFDVGLCENLVFVLTVVWYNLLMSLVSKSVKVYKFSSAWVAATDSNYSDKSPEECKKHETGSTDGQQARCKDRAWHRHMGQRITRQSKHWYLGNWIFCKQAFVRRKKHCHCLSSQICFTYPMVQCFAYLVVHYFTYLTAQ